jgi:hypothetical protein
MKMGVLRNQAGSRKDQRDGTDDRDENVGLGTRASVHDFPPEETRGWLEPEADTSLDGRKPVSVPNSDLRAGIDHTQKKTAAVENALHRAS